ncbi:hypothetical protein [Jidongwangia harbinensis]|uniref:hypothetical protein n=1 Tax=Jidongwangia harbinensis TaxID=2878561 RepID=UPI001CD9395B|nr:hypothetical protein [Jidongwangia harbinensis]MCA2212613.1 hypothetical protein [Jidongwangia harbinensis]
MVDDAAGWAVDWISSRTADDWRRYAWFATALLIAYYTVRWLVRRFVPWLVAEIGLRFASGLVTAMCIALLVVQATLTLPFRPLRVRPPMLFFTVGDLAGGTVRRTRATVPRLAAGVYTLRQTHRLVIWALLAGLLWAGHEVTCERAPASLWCRSPLSAVTALGGDLQVIGTDLVFGRPSS